MIAPPRPALRWYGGKWKLAPCIINHLPPHRVYVEPYGGAMSVLLRKERSYAEVYNDLDGDVVNFFRVLRNEAMAPRLLERLRLTPFARVEFEAAYELTDDPVERASRLAILSFMGFGSNAHSRTPTGFRANSNRSGTTPAHDWCNYPDALSILIDRLRGVIIESRDALQVMAQHDGRHTLHYVDPPYVHATRGRGRMSDVLYRGYAVELSDDDHESLLKFLRTLKGCVVLSGYPHPIYDNLLSDWLRFERAAHADGARDRTEVLWLNDAAFSSLHNRQDDLPLTVSARAMS